MLIKTAACAKINLTLHIVGRREDGYHLLESFVAFTQPGTEACDYLSLSTCSKKNADLSIEGPMTPELLGENDNLILKANDAFLREFPKSKTGHFQLIKNLPIGSGIGGGSSNAAAALRLLALKNKIDPSDPRLYKLAKSLGADVPMCLRQQSYFVEGIGEILTPSPLDIKIPVVLVNPRKPISTVEAFKKANFTKESSSFESHKQSVLEKVITIRELSTYLKSCANDLQEAAISLVPEIKTLIAEFAGQENCLFSAMSGSGATVFGIFETMEEVRSYKKILLQKYPDWWIVESFLQ